MPAPPATDPVKLRAIDILVSGLEPGSRELARIEISAALGILPAPGEDEAEGGWGSAASVN